MSIDPMIISHTREFQYMMLGTKVPDCHHEKDWNIKLKELNNKKKESGWVRASSFSFNSLLCGLQSLH